MAITAEALSQIGEAAEREHMAEHGPELMSDCLSVSCQEFCKSYAPEGNGWMLARSACQVCKLRYIVWVAQRFKAKEIGEFSLSGVQMKFSATSHWVYLCTVCGATGLAEIK
jgi:hypothetical protein